jgi:predicted phosphodiesterase
MRLAFISDIHGNLKALESALKQIKADEIYCLGDIVDRYPDSNKCIELVRKYCKATILGNHDAFSAKYGYAELNEAKRTPDISKGEHLDPEIYREHLTPENQAYLQKCGLNIELDNILLTHTLHDASNPWQYITKEEDAFCGFGLLKKKIAVIGHTHIPKIFEEEKLEKDAYEITKHELKNDKLILEIKENRRYILDVGSVGYCFDDDITGHYGIIENGRMELHKFRI